MRQRGNAAFIFARPGDDRGFQVIKAILENRSPKRAVFMIDDGGHLNPQLQIREDRYYAAHLFGDLKDVRAVPILVPLLRDEEVKGVVPWSLGQWMYLFSERGDLIFARHGTVMASKAQRDA
jgi:hypothetical protein